MLMVQLKLNLKMVNKMNKETLLKAIRDTHSRTFTVVFRKADGTFRTMYGKTEIKSKLSKNPNKRKLVNTDPNVIRVYDKQIDDYRAFKLDSVVEFRCNKTILV